MPPPLGTLGTVGRARGGGSGRQGNARGGQKGGGRQRRVWATAAGRPVVADAPRGGAGGRLHTARARRPTRRARRRAGGGAGARPRSAAAAAAPPVRRWRGPAGDARRPGVGRPPRAARGVRRGRWARPRPVAPDRTGAAAPDAPAWRMALDSREAVGVGRPRPAPGAAGEASGLGGRGSDPSIGPTGSVSIGCACDGTVSSGSAVGGPRAVGWPRHCGRCRCRSDRIGCAPARHPVWRPCSGGLTREAVHGRHYPLCLPHHHCTRLLPAGSFRPYALSLLDAVLLVFFAVPLPCLAVPAVGAASRAAAAGRAAPCRLDHCGQTVGRRRPVTMPDTGVPDTNGAVGTDSRSHKERVR